MVRELADQLAPGRNDICNGASRESYTYEDGIIGKSIRGEEIAAKVDANSRLGRFILASGKGACRMTIATMSITKVDAMIADCARNNNNLGVGETTYRDGIIGTTFYPDCTTNCTINMNSALGRAFIAEDPTMPRTTILTLSFESVFAVIQECVRDYIVTRLLGEKE